ncbi:MAG: hypothetical protein ACLVJK_07235 [Alistipes putredinis]
MRFSSASRPTALLVADPLREAYLHFGLVAQYVGHLIQRGVLIRIEGELQRIDLDAVEIVASARSVNEKGAVTTFSRTLPSAFITILR